MRALTPNLARFFLWLGANSPIPPICIAIEPKLPNEHNAKLARLNYKVLESISLKDTDNNDFSKTGSEQSGLSLVEINLETGRHHQIRVQFASRGNSLYGDQKYGSGPKGEQIALWAYKIEFKHPVKDEIMTFECKPKAIGIWSKFNLI